MIDYSSCRAEVDSVLGLASTESMKYCICSTRTVPGTIQVVAFELLIARAVKPTIVAENYRYNHSLLFALLHGTQEATLSFPLENVVVETAYLTDIPASQHYINNSGIMTKFETDIDDNNDIPSSANIVEHSNCADYEDRHRSWSTCTWDELQSTQDNILSKPDYVTLPTTTDSNNSSNSTLPSSILSEDTKIRLAVQCSLATAATLPGAYYHVDDDGSVDDERGIGGGTRRSAATSLFNNESLIRPKPSQFELARTFQRAYEAQQDALRHNEHGIRSSPLPDLSPLDAFPAQIVACGHETMVHFQQGVAVEEEENERLLKKRKRQTVRTLVASAVFVIVIAGAVFGITFGIADSSHKNATSTNAPDSDREHKISAASFSVDQCYNTTLLEKGDAASERHSKFRLQMISQYPNITSLIDVPYSKENIALCWLSFVDQFQQVSEDEVGLELAQRFVLAILYFCFQGIPTNDLLGDDNMFLVGKWLSDVHVCDWDFVECSDSSPKIITGLKIGAMDLAGRIPSEVAMISTLTSLRCDNNAFTGEVPSEIWTLTQLELLFLGNNFLNGTISKELGNLQQLTDLSLANQLSGTVPDLRSLSKLTYLELSSQSLVGPFPNIQGLTGLGTSRLLSFRVQ